MAGCPVFDWNLPPDILASVSSWRMQLIQHFTSYGHCLDLCHNLLLYCCHHHFVAAAAQTTRKYRLPCASDEKYITSPMAFANQSTRVTLLAFTCTFGWMTAVAHGRCWVITVFLVPGPLPSNKGMVWIHCSDHQFHHSLEMYRLVISSGGATKGSASFARLEGHQDGEGSLDLYNSIK